MPPAERLPGRGGQPQPPLCGRRLWPSARARCSPGPAPILRLPFLQDAPRCPHAVTLAVPLPPRGRRAPQEHGRRGPHLPPGRRWWPDPPGGPRRGLRHRQRGRGRVLHLPHHRRAPVTPARQCQGECPLRRPDETRAVRLQRVPRRLLQLQGEWAACSLCPAQAAASRGGASGSLAGVLPVFANPGGAPNSRPEAGPVPGVEGVGLAQVHDFGAVFWDGCSGAPLLACKSLG